MSLLRSQATAVSVYGADDGTNINGSYYSYGMPLDVERSLGAFCQRQFLFLQYGYGPTFAGVSNWTTPGGNFDFNGPVFGPVGIPVNGNSQGLIAGLGGTVTNQNWLTGQTLWIRWTVMNEFGGSHAFAVDNFQFQATGVPEPSALCSILVIGAFFFCKRTRMN